MMKIDIDDAFVLLHLCECVIVVERRQTFFLLLEEKRGFMTRFPLCVCARVCVHMFFFPPNLGLMYVVLSQHFFSSIFFSTNGWRVASSEHSGGRRSDARHLFVGLHFKVFFFVHFESLLLLRFAQIAGESRVCQKKSLQQQRSQTARDQRFDQMSLLGPP
jgi:hypothetical protein